jgi:transcription elongation GreA/GreB family factor
MSRGFVKEDDLEHAGTDVPERQLSQHPNYVTVNGYAQLEKLAAELEQQRLRLSATKDEQQAQQKLAVINRDLRYVAARLENALVTRPDLNADQVLFGATVTVEDEDGVNHTYEIVGEDEADIKANKVSWVSPLAKALIGHKIGESVVWARPAGNVVLEIIAVNYC